jgi:hypothetical protein
MAFLQMQPQLLLGAPGHEARWPGALLPHNPGMDPAPGMLRVALPRAMKGCNNVLLIMPQWQLVRGNTGSVRLQQRVG